MWDIILESKWDNHRLPENDICHRLKKNSVAILEELMLNCLYTIQALNSNWISTKFCIVLENGFFWRLYCIMLHFLNRYGPSLEHLTVWVTSSSSIEIMSCPLCQQSLLCFCAILYCAAPASLHTRYFTPVLHNIHWSPSLLHCNKHVLHKLPRGCLSHLLSPSPARFLQHLLLH